MRLILEVLRYGVVWQPSEHTCLHHGDGMTALSVDLLSSKVFCDIHLRATSQEVLINLFSNTCLEITISKWLSHLPRANDLTQIFHWGQSKPRFDSSCALRWILAWIDFRRKALSKLESFVKLILLAIWVNAFHIIFLFVFAFQIVWASHF